MRAGHFPSSSPSRPPVTQCLPLLTCLLQGGTCPSLWPLTLSHIIFFSAFFFTTSVYSHHLLSNCFPSLCSAQQPLHLHVWARPYPVSASQLWPDSGGLGVNLKPEAGWGLPVTWQCSEFHWPECRVIWHRVLQVKGYIYTCGYKHWEILKIHFLKRT